MGKKKQGKKTAQAREEALWAMHSRLHARNDFAMAAIVAETLKPEDDIDWDVVAEAAEVIACDACPHDDAEPDGVKDEALVIYRGLDDCIRLVELSARFGGRASLGWAAENTLAGVELEFTEMVSFLRGAIVNP